MKKFGWFLSTLGLTVVLTACPEDEPGGTGGDGTTGGDTDPTDPSGSPTTIPPTTDPTTGDPTTGDPTTGDPTTGDPTTGEPTTGGECTPNDDCMADADCATGQTCVACICVGEPELCADEGWGEGEFGDCVTDDGTIDNSVCGFPGAVCLVDNTEEPTAGFCLLQGCESECDCPQPPEGFESQVVCEQIGGDAMLDCGLGCGGGAECPDGMFCLGDLCYHGEPPEPLPDYSDCVNQAAGQCGSFCLVDDPADIGGGVCMGPCTAAADCPAAPGTGEAAPACADLAGDEMSECYLDCSGGETCPDGMFCFSNLACFWPVIPPYGDCVNNDPTACLATEECVTGDNGGTATGVCAQTGCADETACAAPETGDAVAACADIDDDLENECHLDCSGNAACPDGMACVDDICTWEEN